MAVSMDTSFRKTVLRWLTSKGSASIYDLVEKWEADLEYEQLLSMVYNLVGLGLIDLNVIDSDAEGAISMLSANARTKAYLERTRR